MVKIFYLDEKYPLDKDINLIADLIKAGEIIVFPTDTIYAIGCSLYNKQGVERLLNFTGKMDKKAKLSILCKDIKTISEYVYPYSSSVFRTIKEYSPGPCTFILQANNHLGKFFKTTKSEIGVRIPSNPILAALLQQLEHPMISTSLKFEEAQGNENFDPEYIVDKIKHSVDLMIHSPIENPMESTIIDCTGEEIIVVREGKQIMEQE
jgi:tRNA threonylcarbamoyl adenosine modification protein (Sua5/YciO/YrdC/YwlC family)